MSARRDRGAAPRARERRIRSGFRRRAAAAEPVSSAPTLRGFIAGWGYASVGTAIALVAALDALPEPKLIAGGLLDRSGNVCALGAVAKARGLDVPVMEDPEDAEHTAPEMGKMFGIARSMAGAVMFENEDLVSGETPEARWVRMRAWAVRMLREPKP